MLKRKTLSTPMMSKDINHKIRERKAKTLAKNRRDHRRTGTRKHMKT